MELKEYVFRFMSVRSGNLQKKAERAPQRLPVYERDRETALAKAIELARRNAASAAQIKRIVATYQSSPAHVKHLRELPFDVELGMAWIVEHASDNVASIDFPAAFNALYGRDPATIVGTSEFLETLDRVADTIVAEAIRPSWPEPTDPLSMARKLLALVRWASTGVSPPGDRLGPALVALGITIPEYAVLPRSTPDRTAPPPTRPGDSDAQKQRDKLAALEHAHHELSRTVGNPESLMLHRPPPLAVDEGMSGAGAASRSSRGIAARRVKATMEGPAQDFDGSAMRLTGSATEGLSTTTRQVLTDLSLNASRLNPTALVAAIDDSIQMLSGQLAATQRPNSVMLLGGVAIDSTRLRDSLFALPGIFGPAMFERCNFQAGIGDLLLVKQTLKAYELAEFAHVENVLAGEAREREHRRLDVREETSTSETETETEKERNLQSTERNEMQSEAEKTVKSQFQLDAGLQVSGSYGPAVSFNASLNAGFSTSTEESQRKSVSYSKEVTDKTSEKVRQRVRQEMRKRVLEQIEELNRHSITNLPASNGHIRGIYRWLNKVYDAQILNYGQRMMYEFVVPEPAAYLLYALVENPPRDTELVKPDPPTFNNAPLKPSNIGRTNYLDWVAKYQVRNVPAPPPAFQHVSMFDKQDKVQDGSTFGRGSLIEVPAGYEAYGATVMTDYTFTLGAAHVYHVLVAGTSYDMSSIWGGVFKAINPRSKQLGIAYKLHNAWAFALAIDVHCRLAAEGMAKWQQDVFDAIMEAYLQQKSVYDEKIAAAQIQQGVKILGRNPLENQRITREELKKLVLMMLIGDVNIARNSMLPGAEPKIDLLSACDNGSFIRFFENAFEWNNMLYVLYPYFWGRHARWISALHFTDPDPDFAAFLKAGAARVQVPVRPGFERAVAHFCQFGEIWEGNDAPLRDDELYVPIVDEIAANLGKLDEGVPFPVDSVPWEVRIPTSLVLVQNLEEIPNIRDVLTGNPVSVVT
jgi:hypothetical protein